MFKVDYAGIRKRLKWSHAGVHTHLFFLLIVYIEHTFKIIFLRTYNGRCVCEHPFAAIMRPPTALLSSPHWCKLAADFYPTVKAALRHESANSEEDREGLGCHLGQGLSQACNSRDSLFFCWRRRLSSSAALLRAPPSGWGWIACIHHKASCTKPRGPYRDGSVQIYVPCHR